MKSDSVPPMRSSDGRGVLLSLDSWGRLELSTPDGRRHVGVEPVRAFPISDPAHWISFCDADGREPLSLKSPDGLPPEARRLLDEELALREFAPVIKRIVRVSGDNTPADWDVE